MAIDIEKLAKLSRIKLSDSEKENFKKEFDSILSYVDQIKEASSSAGENNEKQDVRNIFREDESAGQRTNETGKNTEKILKEAPNKKGNYVKVKKIIPQDI